MERPKVEESVRRALAEVFEEAHHEIWQRWLAEVRQRNRDAALRDGELSDAVQDYLATLAAALRQPQTEADWGAALWQKVAHRHALTRVRTSFDIEEMVQDLIVLRRVICARVAERSQSPDLVQQVGCVSDLIAAAISATVKSYVAARDYQSRRLQAEHISFLTHELRNPMSTITLATSQLLRASPTPQQLPLLQAIERGVARLRTLIDVTMLTEQLEAIEVVPRLVRVTLGTVLGPALESARAEARKKGIELRVQASEELPLCVDLSLTISAVQNLVDNAVRFTDTGPVEILVQDGDGHIVLHVFHHCVGLSEEEMRTMFLPFGRGHGNKPGSALGLSVAKRAAELQGGSIHVESSSQSGCHFWMILPKSCPEPNDPSEEVTPHGNDPDHR